MSEYERMGVEESTLSFDAMHSVGRIDWSVR
jgi:hypothetical protein